LYQGKLDWILLNRFEVTAKQVGNHDFSASDHKWLMVDADYKVHSTESSGEVSQSKAEETNA
jgi:hypothetical protein